MVVVPKVLVNEGALRMSFPKCGSELKKENLPYDHSADDPDIALGFRA